MDAEPPKPRPARRPFAAGDFVTRGATEEWAILIDSPLEKPGWQARSPGGVTQSVFPGTTILFEGSYYEVLKIERKPGEEQRYLYYLGPWEDTFPIRTQFAYTREECRRIAAETQRVRQDSNVLLLLALFTPFVGMLPGPDQQRIERTYGLSALRSTTVSAFLLFFLGILCILINLAVAADPSALNGIPILGSMSALSRLLLGAAWTVESILRFFSIKHDEPMGSFLVSFPLELVRAVRREFDPAYRQRRFEQMESGNAVVYLNARDELKARADGCLEVLSILPKPNWSTVTGIHFNGEWYSCVESGQIAAGKSARYRFVLQKAAPGSAFRTTLEYTPEEVRDRFLEKRRVDLGTWVTTFALFWGLLDADDQKRLQKLYGHHPLKFTAWTIFAIGLISGINVATSMMNMSAGVATGADAWWLLGAGYFLLESVLRFQRWIKNEPSGSVLGILLRPFATRILRGY